MNHPMYFAERNNNDHRKEKLVHPFDGRVLPIEPSFIKQQACYLANQLSTDGVDYIVGFAEGGLIPAYAISEATNIPFIGSYRVRLRLPHEIHFIEHHSERSSHFIYGLKSGDNVILIEDEITTGRTLMNVIAQFEERNISVRDIGVYTLNCSSTFLQQFEHGGFQVKYIYSRQDINHTVPVEMIASR
ncbi:phosphoribosyltransferase [Anaerolineales bacterium HSG24]|nr:phosphoribosyltransferase [Anaerolineales bacterium HSG24]